MEFVLSKTKESIQLPKCIPLGPFSLRGFMVSEDVADYGYVNDDYDIDLRIVSYDDGSILFDGYLNGIDFLDVIPDASGLEEMLNKYIESYKGLLAGSITLKVPKETKCGWGWLYAKNHKIGEVVSVSGDAPSLSDLENTQSAGMC